ncbi:unnamed protein product [Arctia plantaginis]|uniref:Integrase catalytic domain-containing protein n=1 Tax=Arctia plantaginis TaxID=874455 RepID=A0A8S1AYB9_ARCPL|nr:unnamed protein product [Arctia plantaginis]
MRSRIFAEKSITYREAVELALALEAAERHAELSGATAPVSASGASVGEGLHSTRAGSAGTSGGGERRTSRYRGAGAKGSNSAASSISLQCWRCGKAHRPDRRRYVNYNCDECNQRGHLKVMCREVQANRSDRQNYVSGYAEDEDLFNIELASKVDAHSKWIEVLPMARTDAQSTITALMSVFGRFGLPSQLVTDYGPPFLSMEFKKYCMNNCIRHVTSAPYRPQANGAAENAVKTVKKAIKRAVHTGENVLQAIHKFLFYYRNCEHASTGVSPAVLLTGRRMRMRLDALRPDVAQVARKAQQRQIAKAGGTPQPSILLGEPVLARDYSVGKNKWSTGTVTEQTGPVSYRVNMDVLVQLDSVIDLFNFT